MEAIKVSILKIHWALVRASKYITTYLLLPFTDCENVTVGVEIL